MGRIKQESFTLVEIMIVVAVIMVLTSVSVSSMLRAKVTGNEANAVVNLRGLFTSLQIYSSGNNGNYPLLLSDLSGYISESLVNGEKSGYEFEYTYQNEDQFYINANPRTPGRSGSKYFYLDETGVMKYSTDGEADTNDSIVK